MSGASSACKPGLPHPWLVHPTAFRPLCRSPQLAQAAAGHDGRLPGLLQNLWVGRWGGREHGVRRGAGLKCECTPLTADVASCNAQSQHLLEVGDEGVAWVGARALVVKRILGCSGGRGGWEGGDWERLVQQPACLITEHSMALAGSMATLGARLHRWQTMAPRTGCRPVQGGSPMVSSDSMNSFSFSAPITSLMVGCMWGWGCVGEGRGSSAHVSNATHTAQRHASMS